MEHIVPSRIRLPVRYWLQKFLLALEPEMKALDYLVINNMRSIDIGANRGIYAYVLSKKSSHVYCFEPLKECCGYITDFQSDSITVTNCALSDVDSNLELYVPLIGFRTVYTQASLERPTGQYEVRNVPVHKLDNYEYKDIGFIKIDVEGVELSVLKGGENTIKNSKPNIMVEIDIHRHSEEAFIAVFDYLYSLDYNAYVYENSKLLPCRDREKELGSSFYNFIFLHHDNNVHNFI